MSWFMLESRFHGFIPVSSCMDLMDIAPARGAKEHARPLNVCQWVCLKLQRPVLHTSLPTSSFRVGGFRETWSTLCFSGHSTRSTTTRHRQRHPSFPICATLLISPHFVAAALAFGHPWSCMLLHLKHHLPRHTLHLPAAHKHDDTKNEPDGAFDVNCFSETTSWPPARGRKKQAT